MNTSYEELINKKCDKLQRQIEEAKILQEILTEIQHVSIDWYAFECIAKDKQCKKFFGFLTEDRLLRFSKLLCRIAEN